MLDEAVTILQMLYCEDIKNSALVRQVLHSYRSIFLTVTPWSRDFLDKLTGPQLA
jgi:hypothetical protein